jgi:hypothetical protein
MKTTEQIKEHIESVLSFLSNWHNLEDFISQFHFSWLKLGQKIQQTLVQQKIEETEANYKETTRSKREKRYYTPLGEIKVKRRVYVTQKGLEVKVDKELGLPTKKWLAQVLELGCALGINSEFPNAHQLFTKWTLIKLTEKSLASTVEKVGINLQESEFNSQIKKSQKIELSSERIYVGVDGVMTPLNQKQGYKEAKVGVIFWEKEHQRKKGGRKEIRQREYIATLKSRLSFRERVQSLYQQIIKQKVPKTIVIGDGAHWIWDMAAKQFPNSIEILDFYHLSEYVWQVAKLGFSHQEEKQKNWVSQQLNLLKQSEWSKVITNSYQLVKKGKNLREAIEKLERYLNNNSTRIDYKSYLKQGLMIGSGVVESSNRRVVTQRLKQAGMHWSKKGAEGIMALRAAYLSSSKRWSNFWLASSCVVS